MEQFRTYTRPDRTTVEREKWWQNGKVSDVPPPGYPV